jgi:cardiolipin synthase
MKVLKYIVITAGLVLALVLALIGIFSITRDISVTNVIAEGDHGGPPSVSDPLFARTMELYTGTHIDSGNVVEIVNNGGVYPPLWRDLASARYTITVQMYYCKPGVLADSMAKYLADRARAKVRVLLLLDAFGSQPLKGKWVNDLRRAGVEVAWLRPLRWYTLHSATQRSHVRVVVVDGRVGYTGGFGLADYWLGDGHHDEQWREGNVKFTGPTVAELQATFAAGWAEATGELITGDLFFPPKAFEPTGTIKAGLMFTVPTVGSTSAERFLALSIVGARKKLYNNN